MIPITDEFFLNLGFSRDKFESYPTSIQKLMRTPLMDRINTNIADIFEEFVDTRRFVGGRDGSTLKVVKYSAARKKYIELCGPAQLNLQQLEAIRHPKRYMRIYRIFSYLNENRSLLYKVFTSSGKSFSAEDITKYAMAILVGGCTSILPSYQHNVNLPGVKWVPHYDPIAGFERSIPVFPPDSVLAQPSPVAILLGMIFAIGTVAIPNIRRNYVKIKDSEAYDVWLKRKKEAIKIESMKRILIEDDVLKDFLCPITKDLPDCPVKAPNYRTYDREAIEEYLEQGKTPPQCNSVFDKRLLRFDYAHANSVIHRIEEIIRAIRGDASFNDLSHLEEFTNSYEERRKKMVAHRLNDVPIISHNSAMSASSKDLEDHYQRIARSFVDVKATAKKVFVCTNSRFELFFINLFSIFGAKRTMVEIEVTPDMFPDVANASDLRKGKISRPIEYQ